MPGELDHEDRVYLEKLRLAVEILLRVGEDPGAMSEILVSELFVYRDHVERALLQPDPS